MENHNDNSTRINARLKGFCLVYFPVLALLNALAVPIFKEHIEMGLGTTAVASVILLCASSAVSFSFIHPEDIARSRRKGLFDVKYDGEKDKLELTRRVSPVTSRERLEYILRMYILIALFLPFVFFFSPAVKFTSAAVLFVSFIALDHRTSPVLKHYAILRDELNEKKRKEERELEEQKKREELGRFR